jgi:hypothetical protein
MLARSDGREAVDVGHRGVAIGPREADPAIRGATWTAWATGPNGERLQAHGDSPEDALLALTVQLRGLGR